MNCAALVRSSLAVAVMLLGGLAEASDFVNIIATRSTATEGGAAGVFTLTRSDATNTLTVFLRVSGTAMPGNGGAPATTLNPADYTLQVAGATPSFTIGTDTVPNTLPTMSYRTMTLRVKFLPGERTKQIDVVAVADALNEGAESVTLEITQDASYITGTFATATVTISDANLTASMSMPDGNATEFVGDQSPSGYFRVQFNNPAAWFSRVLVVENPQADIPGVVAAGASRNIALVGSDYDFTYMYRHSPDGGQIPFNATRVALGGAGAAEFRVVSAILSTGVTTYSGLPIMDFPYPVRNAQVARIQVTSGGQGYSAIPNVTLSPGSGTSPGQATAVVINGKVVAIDMKTASPSSTDWSSVPSVSIDPPAGETGNGAQAVVIMDRGLGQQAKVAGVIDGGVYSITFSHADTFTLFSSAPTLTFSPVDGGTGATITLSNTDVATINGQTGPIYLQSSPGIFTANVGASVSSAGGSGYALPPTVTVSGGGGTGWSATAAIQGKLVAGLVMNAGVGYTSNTVTLNVAAGDGSAISGAPVIGSLTTLNVTMQQNQGRTVAERRSSGVPATTAWKVDGSATLSPFFVQVMETIGFDSTLVNKKNSYFVQYSRGGPGDLVVGDIISFGSGTELYQIAGVSHYLIQLSQPLVADVGDGEDINNAIPSRMDQNRQDASIPYSNLVQYGAMEYDVYPIDDAEPEAAERVISRVYTSADFAIQDPTELTMYIADDEAVANIQLVSNASEGSVEGKALVTISQPLPVDIDIPYLVGGTADSDTYAYNGTIDPSTGKNSQSDYNALPGYVTIKAGETSAEILVTPSLDSYANEANGESVIITLLPTLDVVMSGTQSSGDYPSATINIANQLGIVSVAKLTDGYESSVLPGDGTFEFTAVKATAVVGRDISVLFKLSGTATYGSPDYLLTGGVGVTMAFDPGSKIGSVTLHWDSSTHAYLPADLLVKVVDDRESEGDENVVLTILDGTGYTIDSQHSFTSVTIEDDEPVISISKLSDAVEPNFPGQFMVSYPGVPAANPVALIRSIDIPYVVSGTAQSGIDFGALSGTITIPSRSKSVLLDVVPLADDLVESDETVIVTLLPGVGYTLKDDNATMNILDNKTVGIVAGRDLNEAGPTAGQFTASFSGPALSGPLTITYKIDTAAGTAVADLDFDTTGYTKSGNDYVKTAVIPAGSTSVLIDVPALDDGIIDPDKTLVIDLVDTTSYAVDPDKASATLKCQDDEPLPTFTAVRDANEGGVSGVIRISVPAANAIHAIAYTIPIRFSGTATVGTDYTVSDGTSHGSVADFTATIPIDQGSVDVRILTIDDALAEGAETVTASLLLGNTPQTDVGHFATISLNDNEPAVSIAATVDASEPTTPGTFTISRTGATTAALTVHYALGAGTAVLGTDYTGFPAIGTVVIPIGQASATLTVNPSDDNVVEGTETITVDLTADPAYLINTGSATMNLLDDEPTVSIAVGNSNLNEPSDATTLTISATGTIVTSLTVPITVTGTATEGVDYTSIPASVILTAAAPSVTIPFHVLDDFTVENPPETAIFTLGGGGLGTSYAIGTGSVTVHITDDAVDATIDPHGPPPGSVLNQSSSGNCGAGSGLATMIGGLLALVLVGRSRRR